ncbi:MAG TPA: hypothetical protein VFQ54_12475 [Thermomicrobiales bacterium]|nr:hypothetical protein [Thermomicrobiales bacterium]
MPKLVRLVAVAAVLTLVVRKKRDFRTQRQIMRSRLVQFPQRGGRNQPVYV